MEPMPLGQAPTLDVETDDSNAADLLEMMEREDAGEPEVKEEAPEAVPQTKDRWSKQEGSLALESVYFRSFGNRPLLTREEEIGIAKRIDQGTRSIRVTLRDAIVVATQMPKDEKVMDLLGSLKEIRVLSGFSATALDRADANLASLQELSRGTTRVAAHRVKQLAAFRKQVREARKLLE